MAADDEVPLPSRISAQYHLQAWLDPAGALNIRMTDGLSGWEAVLDASKLRTLAEAKNFRDDAGLAQYRELTLSSLTTCGADCTFSADREGGDVIMRWSRVCVIDGIPERVSGDARGAESKAVFGAMREQLAARLNKSASTIAALENSIASINTQLDRALKLTDNVRSRLTTLRADRAARFHGELNAKKRALQAACDDGSEAGSPGRDLDVDAWQGDGESAEIGSPAASSRGPSVRANAPDDHAKGVCTQSEGLMGLLDL